MTSHSEARIVFYFSGIASSTTMRQSFNYPMENGFCCVVKFGFWAFVYFFVISLTLSLSRSQSFLCFHPEMALSHLSVWYTWQKAFNHCMVSLSPHCIALLEYTQKHKHRKEEKELSVLQFHRIWVFASLYSRLNYENSNQRGYRLVCTLSSFLWESCSPLFFFFFLFL